MTNCIVAQSGGPTSVINATVAGVVKGNQMNPIYDHVFGGLNGIEGILAERFVDLTDMSEEENHILQQTPSSALGSCRYKLKRDNVEDFEKLIKQYDRPESFFYCDPPYYETEDYYEDVGFTTKDHERLANALCSMQGKFLLSYNDCPEIRELYSRPGIIIEGTSRLSNIAQRYEAGKQYAELIISNYDTEEKIKAIRQLSLFDMVEESRQLLKERKIIWTSE